jgi:hypothetical protein
MRKASDILNHPAAMQIRYIKTLQAMSSHAGTKVIFMPTTQENLNMKDAAIYENMSDAVLALQIHRSYVSQVKLM